MFISASVPLAALQVTEKAIFKENLLTIDDLCAFIVQPRVLIDFYVSICGGLCLIEL